MRAGFTIRAVSVCHGLYTGAGRLRCVLAVCRRQTASQRRADCSESTPPTHLRCVMLSIEVSRRRASKFYDPCRQRVGCTAAGAGGLRCVIAVCRRQTASQRRADGSLSIPSTQLRCAMLNIEVGRRRASRFYDPCRQRVGCTCSRGGQAAMRDCGLQATDRVAASSRLLLEHPTDPPEVCDA